MQVTFEIWQLPMSNNLVFRNYSQWEKMDKIPEWSDYVRVYERTDNPGTLNTKEFLERIFTEFNINEPKDFFGRTLSVSDVVTVNGEAYFCDYVGWKKVEKF